MSESPASPTPTEHPAGGLRELLAVAVPLIISSGSLALMHVVDRVMLTWLSVDAMAASLPGGMLHWTLLSFPFGIAVYTNTFVAQYDGAGRRDRVAASIWQGLLMATLAGILLAVTVPWTQLLVLLFDHAPEVQQLETEYFSILAFGSLPALVSAVLSSFFSGRGRTRVLMIVNIITSLANGVFNYFLIFGVGSWPGLGIAGAAWGTVLAQLLGCVLYVVWMAIDAESRSYPFAGQCGVELDLLRRMVRYGLPNGVQYLVDVAAYMVLTVFIGRIGEQALGATVLAFNLNSMAFIPIFGVGMAVTTLVGRRIGEGRAGLAVRTAWMAMGLAAVYTAVWAAVYLFAPDLILAPYALNSDPAEFEALRPIVITLLYFVVLYSFFDALAVVFGSATRGAGDTRFSLVYTGVVAWACMVLPVWWIWRQVDAAQAAPPVSPGAWDWREWGLYACWGAVCAQIMVLGVGFWLRFVQGRWLTMRVIEPHVVETETAPLDDAA
jgi:MATE family multidrug resistance protein